MLRNSQNVKIPGNKLAVGAQRNSTGAPIQPVGYMLRLIKIQFICSCLICHTSSVSNPFYCFFQPYSVFAVWQKSGSRACLPTFCSLDYEQCQFPSGQRELVC